MDFWIPEDLLCFFYFITFSNWGPKKKESTLLAFLLFFIIGISSVYIHDTRNFKNAYSSFLNRDSKVVLRISKILNPTFYHKKYRAEVIQVNKEETRGSILLNLQKDSTIKNLKVDELILVSSFFTNVLPPLNPSQFNYKAYLAKQGIYHQLFLENYQFLKYAKSQITLQGIAGGFRDKVQYSLSSQGFKKDELAVLSALLLGQRQAVSKELLSHYAAAGAIHILAISGLHVGIILLILTFLLSPLEKRKNGRYLKAFSIVLMLWAFAFIAGLSASVVRAVTMFTFVAVGQAVKRRNRVEFSLISSMLLLLIVKPMFLFDVGFQLSYLAVFGIVWLQPKLVVLYSPRFIISRKIWQLITVSIAAQAGILPLSIYYFHQFPGLFIVSNVVIIPFLGFILMGGIVVVVLSLLQLLPSFLVVIYGGLISLMNGFVNWISLQESFLFKDLGISFLMLLVFYGLLFTGVLFLIKKNTWRLGCFLLAILCLQSAYLFEEICANDAETFIVFHKSRAAIIGLRNGKELEIQSSVDSVKLTAMKVLKPYLSGKRFSTIKKINFKNYIRFNSQDILLVDSLGMYQIQNLRNPIVILQHSPKINLERLFETLKPSLIVVDGSNYKSQVDHWRTVSVENKIHFYNTAQKGAFVLENEP
ncbi:competence protein [Polaribacter irgensii 23-P]|uniref:Competence protein n=1 Tax=Polaribacter irgensii 23-P TaxID=313594 RepID=A4C2L2_9FLAO|nr:ComEC/Rec2 family competence protein [Polaribacter irgensii]EAR11813.1 competence protein [Polaribacter irgensii 23-P]